MGCLEENQIMPTIDLHIVLYIADALLTLKVSSLFNLYLSVHISHVFAFSLGFIFLYCVLSMLPFSLTESNSVLNMRK